METVKNVLVLDHQYGPVYYHDYDDHIFDIIIYLNIIMIINMDDYIFPIYGK